VLLVGDYLMLEAAKQKFSTIMDYVAVIFNFCVSVNVLALIF
jgi:hypothetical protein